MEIITRQQAISRGLNKYFTGVPCKRGHVCERYTQMCACLECLHPKAATEERLKVRHEALLQNQQVAAERLRVHAARQTAKLRMERLRIGVYTPHLGQVRDLVYALAVSREPLLKMEDVLTPCKPDSRGPNTFLHAFRVFREDIDTITAFNRLMVAPEAIETVIRDRDERNKTLTTY